MWEEIHGFRSLREFNKFVEYIENKVTAGEVVEIVPDPRFGKGEIYGGRWFKVASTGIIWRLVPPDIPFKGSWEPVEI